METHALAPVDSTDAKEANRQKFRRFYAQHKEDVRRRVRERYWLLTHGIADPALLPPVRRYLKSPLIANTL